MCNSSGPSKAVMGFISFLFWACAAGLLFISIWVFVEYRHYQYLAQALYILVPASFLLATGCFFIVLGILGCVGACKEKKCILGLFFTLTLIILVGMICAASLGWVYREDVDSAVNDGLMKGLQRYDMENETYWQSEVDFMQTEMKCCGVGNYTDWLATPWHDRTTKPYPESCCTGLNCTYTAQDKNLNPNGCYSLMKDQFMMHLGVIAGVAAAFAVVLILGMAFSCVLICKRRSEVPYIGLNEPSGMRV